jgi:sugar transferase (PEP-CTERM system associated)
VFFSSDGYGKPEGKFILKRTAGFTVGPATWVAALPHRVLHRHGNNLARTQKTQQTEIDGPRGRPLIRFLHAYFPKRTFFLCISEACLVSLAFFAATVARLGSDATFMLHYRHGTLKIIAASVSVITCMYYFDLYDSWILGNRREGLIRLIQVLGTVYSLSVLLYYFYPPLELGRGIFVIGLLLVAVLLFFWRRLFSKINSISEFANRALILGEGSLAERLQHEFESRPELGLRVVGRVSPSNNGNCHVACERAESSGLPLCAETVEDLSRTVKRLRASRVVVAMDERRGKLPVDGLLSLKCRGLQVQDGVTAYEEITGKVPIESVRSGWLLFSPGCRASRLYLIYKRTASILVSVVGLILSAPLVLFAILAIRLSSPGPIFYRQKRVGRDGTAFACYKFRTMRADAEAGTGPTWARDDDPRITRVGRFLRHSRIDEIPQLWNVFRGDMSLVGPRPERPEFVGLLERQIPYYNLRHSIRPGITGWAQVRYKYGNSIGDAQEKLRYDLYYIKNMSAGLDLLIVFDTLKTLLLRRGAK